MRRRLTGLAAMVVLLAAPVAAGRPAGAGKRPGGAVGPARNRAATPARHGSAKGREPGAVPRRTGKTSHRSDPSHPHRVPRPSAAPHARAARPVAAKPAVSVGSPTDGRLQGGVALRERPGVRLKHTDGPHWGLPRLIALLERGARKVDARFQGSVMLVGDLSRSSGGDLGGHRSHESGRDADVGFYYADSAGRPVETTRFHHVGWDGRAADARALHFDDARNWELVKAWVTDPHARVQHIFVAAPLRTRLLVFAREHGTYLPVLQRAAIAMKQPSHALPHDDHFHVRIACPSGQRDVCVPEPARSKAPARAAQAKKRPAPRVRRRH